MKQYETFIFDSYGFDPAKGEIRLRYTLDDDISFTEILNVPKGLFGKSLEDLQSALHALHMAGGVSYYKTCCPKNIEVRSGTLNAAQADFWNTVYEKGLGEFFYQNKIDFRHLISFPSGTESVPNVSSAPHRHSGRSLVPIGGGKDSIVTLEKLRAIEGKKITLLRMGSHPLIDEMVSVSGLQCIEVQRKLPRKLFEMNNQGALNGHVPITAFLSTLSVFVAELMGFDEVVMSNESSANEGNVEYLGTKINHQWSKSAEFEHAFANYIQEYIDPSLRYFSALRDMNELQIVEEFVKYPQYFHCMTSCNKNWKIAGTKQKQRWCGTCPKCTFVFALVAAQASKETVLKIFEKNIFEDASTEPLFKQLLGKEGFKPFECVGTPKETTEAFDMIKNRGDFKGTAIMDMYQKSA